jgi:hypothetical protein
VSEAQDAIWIVGPTGPLNFDVYSGVTTFPLIFGLGGGAIFPQSGSGSFGIVLNGINRTLLVPTGYISDTVISGTSTYENISLLTMGLSTGDIFTWSWGSGENTSTIVMKII